MLLNAWNQRIEIEVNLYFFLLKNLNLCIQYTRHRIDVLTLHHDNLACNNTTGHSMAGYSIICDD